MSRWRRAATCQRTRSRRWAFFTTEDADQLRYIPELVLINRCHLGQTREDPGPHAPFHQLAANLATQFIRTGARAVVAAGSAVDDAADTFYREMLRGSLRRCGTQARRVTFTTYGETNTWGAYQCYGDPSFSLDDAMS